uniref:Paired amphipathic helix protein Sin3-like 2 n=1 Tax=Solanum tuberosum TaxID=4113 RepID=M0ZLV9_SOLTU
MRRLGGDVCGSSRGESYNQSQFHESGLSEIRDDSRKNSKPEYYDALSYLKEVKDMFSDQAEKYNMFLDVMTDFKRKRIDTVGVIAKIKELFKGHPRLLLGFNLFLPNGYEIILTDEDKKKTDLEQAISLMNKIKKCLGNDYEYKSFINILSMCKKECKNVEEVNREVAILLKNHPDLVDEFAKFLVDSSIANLLSNLDDNKILKNMARLKVQVSASASANEKLKRPIRELYGQSQFCEGGSGKRGGDRGSVGGNASNPNVTTNDALTYLKEIIKDMFPDQNRYGKGFTFCEKVKKRLHSPTDYQTFLKCLRFYSRDIVSRQQLQSLVRFQSDNRVYGSFLAILKMYKEHKNIDKVYHEVAILFKDHPDLLDDFTKYLPDSSPNVVLKRYMDELTIRFSFL